MDSRVSNIKQMRVNQQRLWKSHVQMAEIGALPLGGSCRLSLSEDDKKGRELFIGWCREAGCDIRIDKMGCIYARRPGKENLRPPAATGSHLDTQPHGGKYDGVYGVLAGLEVIRTLNDHQVETHAPIEVIVWTNEEGVRFSPPLTGSQVFCGRLPLENAHALQTIDGTTVFDDLKSLDYLGEDINGENHPMVCFIETHIEQGPILEKAKQQIGVVTMIQGALASAVRIKGADNHAGTTPLNMRQDALVGAARIVSRLNEIGLENDEATRVTVGRFDVSPNSTSSIPGEVFFHIDLRHPEQATLERLDTQFRAEVSSICSQLGLEFEYETMMGIAPTLFDAQVVEVVNEVTKTLGYPHRRMISGAGHDAMNTAVVAPTAMIFVPCEGGISHNEAEAAKPEDLAAGANVLLHSLIEFSGIV
jgi:beta-ureidopropionase / N-carbamoyl-L-amino-acid hydrolase